MEKRRSLKQIINADIKFMPTTTSQKQPLSQNPAVKLWLESPEFKEFLNKVSEGHIIKPEQQHYSPKEEIIIIKPHPKTKLPWPKVKEEEFGPEFEEIKKDLEKKDKLRRTTIHEYQYKIMYLTKYNDTPAPTPHRNQPIANELVQAIFSNPIHTVQTSEHKQKAKQILKEGNIDELVLELETFAQNKALPADSVHKKIKDFTKEEHKKDVNFNDYSILKDCYSGYSKRFRHIYHDGQYSFVLCHLGQGIATISFDSTDNAIKVYQIQGVLGEKETLQKIKWERMLLTLVCEWAQEHKIKEVQVQPKKSNHWGRIRQENIADHVADNVHLELTNIVKNQNGAYAAQIKLNSYEAGAAKSTEIKGLSIGDEETFVLNKRLINVSVLEISQDGMAANVCVNGINNQRLKIAGNFLYDITAKKCKFKYDLEKAVYRRQIS